MEDHAPAGLLIAAIGAAVLAISVFEPWYGMTVTPAGAAAAQSELASVAQRYGNPRFQTEVNGLGVQFGSLAGRQVAKVSGHQVSKDLSNILLALAGIALLASLLRLADMRGLFFATGSQITLVGGLAFGIAFFRFIWGPAAGQGLISLQPTWGLWLSLVSAIAIVAGGLVAGSDRTRHRTTQRIGPGPPPLGTPPNARAIAQGASLRPPSRRR